MVNNLYAISGFNATWESVNGSCEHRDVCGSHLIMFFYLTTFPTLPTLSHISVAFISRRVLKPHRRDGRRLPPGHCSGYSRNRRFRKVLTPRVILPTNKGYRTCSRSSDSTTLEIFKFNLIPGSELQHLIVHLG